MREILPEIEGWVNAGKQVAIATVVKVYGSAPRRLGAKMAVNQDGLMAGSVSGGCVENAVVTEALEVIETGKSRLVAYGITTDQAMSVGLACGGTIEVFIERLQAEQFESLRDELASNRLVLKVTALSGKACGATFLAYPDGRHTQSFLPDDIREKITDELLQSLSNSRLTTKLENEEVDVFGEVFTPAEKLIIIGAVHIAIPLVTFGKALGFYTIVLDPRRAFANLERFPHVDDLVVEWPQEKLEALGLDEGSYVVVISHDEKLDVPALAAACRSKARYIGALGSRKTFEKNKEGLREEGVTEEQIARIFSPIGLDIGARGAEEIALSIMAEVIAVRNGVRIAPGQ